jgi:hypothetical protein
MTIREYWVTTTDNPFDPFTQWEDWYRFDMQNGYNLLGYVARDPGVASVPSDAPPATLQRALEQAIDTICQFNLTCVEGVYFKKVSREVEIKDDIVE